MKKLSLLLAFAPFALAGAPAGAQNTAAPTAPATPTAPAPVDPAVSAFLAKSTAAYAQLNGLSANVSTSDTMAGKTTTSSGTLAFSRPDKAKFETKIGTEPLLFQTDGTKVIIQFGTKNYQTIKMTGEKAMMTVLGGFPSAMQVVLPSLVEGKSLFEGPLKWEKVALLPDNGLTMTLPNKAPTPELKLNLYFDPTDNLLRRVEAKRTLKDGESVNITTLSNVTSDPAFATAAFTFTPAEGVTEEVEKPSYDPKLVVGAAPYALIGADLNGKTLPWKQYAGKVVLLDFWATWCGPCIQELPNVLSSYKKYKPQGFDIIGVSLDEDKAALTNFIKARQMPWPQLFDAKGWKNANAVAYGIQAIPFTPLIGKDGKIAGVNLRGEELDPAIKAALAK